MTLRLRLTLLYSIIAIFILSVFAITVYFNVRLQIYKSAENRLLETGKAVLKEFNSRGIDDKEVEVIKRVGNDFYHIEIKDGMTMISSLNSSNLKWPVKTEYLIKALSGVNQSEIINRKGENLKILYMPADADHVLLTGMSLTNVERDVRNISLFISYIALILISLAIFMGWTIAGIAVSPLKKLNTSIKDALSKGIQEKIVGVFGSREAEELADSLNEIIENNRRESEIQRSFASSVSHEIRSPLTSLRGSMEVALRKARNTSEYEAILRENLNDVIRLSKTIDNLLILTKAENRTLEYRKQRFDINSVLNRIIERYRQKAMSGGITIKEIYGNVVEITGDLELLELAFANIIDNAIKYTRFGGYMIISTFQEGNMIAIKIKDSGIGIPEDELPLIFEKFHRGKGPGKKASGTGLGLSITQTVIKAHNGDISIKSNPGFGTEIMVKLPCITL